MNPARIIRFVALCLAATVAIVPIAAHRADAQTLTWDGGTNNNWSNDSADVNWSGNPWSPGATAWFAADSNGSVDYTVKLTDDIVASNLRLYNLVGTDPNNDVKVTLQGSLSLTINATGNLSLGPQAATSPTGETVLDMGGLGTFNFNGASHIFRVGLHPGSGATHTSTTTVSTVTLADTNTITANALYMGDQNASGGGGRSYLYLGRDNTINANTISIGSLTNHVRSTAYFQFADGLTDPSATFRGTTGTSAVPNWNIGRVATSSTTTWNTVVDLSAGKVDALVTNMLLGDGNINNNTNRAGIVNATFTMGDGTMEVETLGIGRVTGSGSLREGHDYSGNGTFNIVHADAEFTADTINIATMNHTATGGTPTTTGLFYLADGTATVNGDIVLGSNTKGADANSGGVTATVRQSGGEFTISGGLLEGSNAGGEFSSNVELFGGKMTVGGNVAVDELIVGDDKREASFTANGENRTLTIGKLTVAADSATGTFTAGTGAAVEIGTAAAPTDLFIARKTDAVALSGTVDLSAADSLVAHLDRLFMAYQRTSHTTGGNTATFKLAGTSEIYADHILLGQVESGATTVTSATIELGENNTVLADTLTIGGGKSTGTVKFADDVTGGVLNLGAENARVDLNIGYNVPLDTSWSTSRTADGHLDGSGGTINAWLGEVVIGYHGNSGTGKGVGTLTIESGTVDANSIFMGHGIGTNPQDSEGTIELTGGTISVHGDVTSGSGSGTLIINDGTMTVGGNLEVSALRVGRDQSTATLTVNGDDVRIGTETSRSDLVVGYTEGHDLHSEGTLNFENVTNLTAYLDDFMIGWRRTSSNGGGTAKGTVTLAENNYIDAATIVVSQNEYWNTDPESVLTLGADNTLKVDTFSVAGWRANGRVDLPAGGVLNLTGSSGAATDLLIADNNIGTGHDGVGTMDLSAGTFNATLNNLVIGYHLSGGGSGTGTLDFAAGAVTANSVVLGDAGSSTGTGIGTLDMAGGSFTVSGPVTLGTGHTTSQGTINLSGGTLWADSITKGVGQAMFNWTGGTLSVDHFGFDLTQNGGTLAPGNSIGTTTIDGNYTMDTGTLEIEIAGPESHDFVMVYGNAMLTGDLSVLLLDEYMPALGTHFDVLQTTGSLDISGLALAGDLPSTTFGWWDLGAIPSGDGFLLRLSAVPEPSSAVLLMLGVAVLLGWRRRRR